MKEQVAKDAAADIDRLIKERLGPLVQAAVAANRPALLAQARRESALDTGPLFRPITQSQKLKLHDAVQQSEVLNATDQNHHSYPRLITIYVDPSDEEANAYAKQISDLLHNEGWGTQFKSDPIDELSIPGLHFVQRKVVPAGSRGLGTRANADLFRCLNLAEIKGDMQTTSANFSPLEDRPFEGAFIVVGPKPLAKLKP